MHLICLNEFVLKELKNKEAFKKRLNSFLKVECMVLSVSQLRFACRDELVHRGDAGGKMGRCACIMSLSFMEWDVLPAERRASKQWC